MAGWSVTDAASPRRRVVIGERFGAHQVLRQIAGGFAARVYLASDGTDVCAVKIFGPSFTARAEREHRFGNGLQHPRLNQVLELLEISGNPAVRMPFIPGVQVTRWLARHGTRDGVIDLALDLLDALGYLHDRGIVHRDVKPENVLVGSDDRPVLIDFDLAAGVGETVLGRGWAGTAAYLSPDRMEGSPASPADDLYAAAVVLYRGLTGALPFEGGFHDALSRKRMAAPPPSVHDPDLAAFDAWMARALAPDPDERHATAVQMRAALREAADRTGDGSPTRGREPR